MTKPSSLDEYYTAREIARERRGGAHHPGSQLIRAGPEKMSQTFIVSDVRAILFRVWGSVYWASSIDEPVRDPA